MPDEPPGGSRWLAAKLLPVAAAFTATSAESASTLISSSRGKVIDAEVSFDRHSRDPGEEVVEDAADLTESLPDPGVFLQEMTCLSQRIYKTAEFQNLFATTGLDLIFQVKLEDALSFEFSDTHACTYNLDLRGNAAGLREELEGLYILCLPALLRARERRGGGGGPSESEDWPFGSAGSAVKVDGLQQPGQGAAEFATE
ncbi:hypothetical protein B0H13DRAFT_1869869 [Mycena leptocephala]|nr:hypothetical protein B0H13DRAFT_1869869 [Mycena leptocephala]